MLWKTEGAKVGEEGWVPALFRNNRKDGVLSQFLSFVFVSSFVWFFWVLLLFVKWHLFCSRVPIFLPLIEHNDLRPWGALGISVASGQIPGLFFLPFAKTLLHLASQSALNHLHGDPCSGSLFSARNW